MTRIARYLGLAALTLSLGALPAAAQQNVPSAKAPLQSNVQPKTAQPRTEKSLECSKQADAKKLHGTERKKFREECKKAG